LSDRPLSVLVWNEFIHEREAGVPRDIYPDGIHAALAQFLSAALPEAVVRTATLLDADCGITDAALSDVDVLIWWGHMAHDQVPDSVVDLVQEHVLRGLGLILLHSAAESKLFKRLMGTTCSFRWRESSDRELIWVTDPSHPIARNLPAVVTLPEHEMYGEFFDIPTPESVVFISSFTGGEVFRSGCTFRRGDGRIFYFSPGHETYPIYHDPHVQQILANAVTWAAGTRSRRPARKFVKSPLGWFDGAGTSPG
jgi:trehalose utilization protein